MYPGTSVSVQQNVIRNTTCKHVSACSRCIFSGIKRHIILHVTVFLCQTTNNPFLLYWVAGLAGGLGTRLTQCFLQTVDRLSLRLIFSVNRGVRIRLYLFRFVKGIDNNRILFFLAGNALLHGRFVQATAGNTGQQMVGSTGLFVRWVALDLWVSTRRRRTRTGVLD